MTKKEMDHAVGKARLLTKVICEMGNSNVTRGCLQHAVAMNITMGAPIVAGNAGWKFTNDDDGFNSTHLSYMFDDYYKENSGDMLIYDNILPEMHVWNIWQGKVLDTSTIHWPVNFKNAFLSGTWDAEIPPEYHWGKTTNKKKNYFYEKRILATNLALKCADIIKKELDDIVK